MKKLNHPLIYLSIITLILPIYFGLQKQDKVVEEISDTQDPTLGDLYDALRQENKITLVYPSESSALKAVAQKIKEGSRRIKIDIREDHSLQKDELENQILMLIGSPNTNDHIPAFLEQLPLHYQDQVFHFDGKSYEDPTVTLSLPFYPNPFNRRLPVVLFTGHDDQVIAQLLEGQYANQRRFRWANWGYEVYQGSKRLVLGRFDEQSWEMNKKIHFDFANSSRILAETDRFAFHCHNMNSDQKKLQGVVEACETAADQLLSFIGKEAPEEKISIHLYCSAEEKGLMLGNTDHSHADFTELEIHTVINDIYGDNLVGKENEVLLRQVLGEPKRKALETGLAIYFAPKWQYKGHEHWAKRLAQSDNLAPLSEVLDNEMQAIDSRLVLGCLSASFVTFLIEDWGKEQFLQQYLTWDPTEAEVKKLEKKWQKYLSRKEAAPIDQKIEEAPLPYLKGFNFAHEGYDIYNGYLSQQAAQAIDKLVDLNCNALSIVPYSYIRDPNQPSYIGISNRAGSENDESVVHSAYQAKKRGMTVMLKPQIWLGRGHWPGDVEMKNEADWQAFFEHYYRWIRHYALMAEIHDMDLLCIGTEFAKATIQREEDWRKLIRKIRGIYSGKITYAANWGDEFEQLQFWDELDYMGLDCYYPLSKANKVSDEELNKGFKKVLTKIEKIALENNKPLLFTEIGFRSIEAPWKNPHASAGEADYNGDHQKICYETVFKGIADKPWCHGILWWKFPTELEDMGHRQKGFTPNKKPAELVVKEWFGRL